LDGQLGVPEGGRLEEHPHPLDAPQGVVSDRMGTRASGSASAAGNATVDVLVATPQPLRHPSLLPAIPTPTPTPSATPTPPREGAGREGLGEEDGGLTGERVEPEGGAPLQAALQDLVSRYPLDVLWVGE
jgi:hypothetical protein